MAALGDDLRIRDWRRPGLAARREWRRLDRLLRPLTDACAVLVDKPHSRQERRCAGAAVAAVLRRCRQEGTAFWGWPARTWVRILGSNQAAFRAAQVDRRRGEGALLQGAVPHH